MLWYPEGLRRTSRSSCSSARAARTAGSPTAACSSASRTRSRRRGPTSAPRPARPRPTTPGSRSTAATRSSSTTASSGETRKTGSIYTFDNNDIDQIGHGQDARRVGGLRDQGRGPARTRSAATASVINEFENTPGQAARTARGDPSTTLRQFTQGYIGLQNHSGADRIQYRNIRVEDLSPGAPRLVDGRSRSRSPARARTRSRSARPTRPATSGGQEDVRRSRSAPRRRPARR